MAVVATAAVTGVKMFGDMIRRQAEQLEGYSPDISVATSLNEIKRDMAMFRRADIIGPQVARWESLRGDVSERLTDINTAILEAILDTAERYKPLTDLAMGLLDKIADNAGGIGTLVEILLNSQVPPLLRAINFAVGRMDARQEQQQEIDPFLLELERILPNRLQQDRQIAQANPAPATRPLDRPLNVNSAAAAAGFGAGGP
jgi:hypothetical protein